MSLTETERQSMRVLGAQNSPTNRTLTKCPICDLEVWEDFISLHVEVNHPTPRERWWLRWLRWLVAVQTIGCGGSPFALLEIQPTRTQDAIPQDAIPQEASTEPAHDVQDVRDVPDAGDWGGGWDGDSRSDTGVDIDGGDVAPRREATPAPDAQPGATKYPETSTPSPESGCPPPVAGGYSNICATAPSRGETVISTFPGECACNWTCACLMTSSVCAQLGRAVSCTIVNGAVCNSVVVAVVTCQ